MVRPSPLGAEGEGDALASWCSRAGSCRKISIATTRPETRIAPNTPIKGAIAGRVGAPELGCGDASAAVVGVAEEAALVGELERSSAARLSPHWGQKRKFILPTGASFA